MFRNSLSVAASDAASIDASSFLLRLRSSKFYLLAFFSFDQKLCSKSTVAPKASEIFHCKVKNWLAYWHFAVVYVRSIDHSVSCPFGQLSIKSFVHSVICPFGQLSIKSFVHSVICPFSHLSIWSFVHLVICPFSHLSIWTVVHLFSCPFGQLSICSVVHLVNCPQPKISFSRKKFLFVMDRVPPKDLRSYWGKTWRETTQSRFWQVHNIWPAAGPMSQIIWSESFLLNH